MLLAVKSTSAFDSLTRPERVKVLLLDDSVIKRNCSKTVELLARVFDHEEHKCQKGFNLLTLDWSDRYSYIPTGFNMLSSANKSNRYNEVSQGIDHRKNGFKFRRESMMRKTDPAILLIKNALNAGKYYTYKGKQYKLRELKKFVSFEGARNIFGSLVVTTKTGISVKIVFVRNRNKKSKCLYILSTDISLEDAEIVSVYGNRWSIDCFFKSSKSFLKLGTEFQSHNYGAMLSHTAIV